MDVAAGIALNATNFVLVFGNDDVGCVGLTFRAISLNVGPDLVDIILEHEVHGCAPVLLAKNPGRVLSISPRRVSSGRARRDSRGL
jgi:hypothetical protein